MDRTTQPGRAIKNASSISSRSAKDPVYSAAVHRGKISIGQQECDLLICKTQGSVNGTGLFAKQDIADGEVILMGVAKYILKQTQTSEQLKYSLEIYQPVEGIYSSVTMDFTDAESSNMLRYINAPGEGKSPNTKLYWKGPVPFLATCKGVKAGDELLLQYSF